MARRTISNEAEHFGGVTTYNSMLTINGKTKKRWCNGCGGPRDPEYAETHPCGMCGALGTRKTQPLFDEDGDPIPEGEQTVEARKARAPRKEEAPVETEAFDTPLVVRTLGVPRKPLLEIPADEIEAALEETGALKPVNPVKTVRPPRDVSRTSDRQPNAQVLPQTAGKSLADFFL